MILLFVLLIFTTPDLSMGEICLLLYLYMIRLLYPYVILNTYTLYILPIIKDPLLSIYD